MSPGPAGFSRSGAVRPRPRPRRRVRALPLALTLVFTSSCVTRIPLSTEPTPDDPGVLYLGEDGTRVGWVSAGDSTVLAEGLRVDPLRRELAMRLFPGDSVVLPLDRVREIEFRQPGRGALEGLGAAALVATVAGLAAALLSDGEGERTRAEQGVRVGAITAVFAVPVGFVIGLGAGHTTFIQVRSPR